MAMAFQRDDALIARLRQLPGNKRVLDTVERSSAHGDLGEVLFHYAASTGSMRASSRCGPRPTPRSWPRVRTTIGSLLPRRA